MLKWLEITNKGIPDLRVALLSLVLLIHSAVVSPIDRTTCWSKMGLKVLKTKLAQLGVDKIS